MWFVVVVQRGGEDGWEVRLEFWGGRWRGVVEEAG